ncbi:hypothetical protein [Parasulfitobacter algicola]|uniref:Uncharacterized protein n=1 Tax=Parasulfitobacter algicola TaxID=2614809 RepID=A0ABX2ILZ2_9RHOB|nr:hypothetical protein [Sulfitobacter algicola]NSX53884.1 hypothetical protein [Sulfitobacter algicola]
MGAFLIFAFSTPLLVLLFLACMPAGRVFFWALAGSVVLWILAAMLVLPLKPSSGPDDWFHGIELIPLIGSGIVIALVTPAQIWRWYRLRRGLPTLYLPALVILIAPVGAFIMFGPF